MHSGFETLYHVGGFQSQCTLATLYKGSFNWHNYLLDQPSYQKKQCARMASATEGKLHPTRGFVPCVSQHISASSPLMANKIVKDVSSK